VTGSSHIGTEAVAVGLKNIRKNVLSMILLIWNTSLTNDQTVIKTDWLCLDFVRILIPGWAKDG